MSMAKIHSTIVPGRLHVFKWETGNMESETRKKINDMMAQGASVEYGDDGRQEWFVDGEVWKDGVTGQHKWNTSGTRAAHNRTLHTLHVDGTHEKKFIKVVWLNPFKRS